MSIRLLHLWLMLAVPIAGAQIAAISSGPAKVELQMGTELLNHGSLQSAIPHLIAAQKAGADPYASGVNLAICYLGLRRYEEGTAVLTSLRSSGYKTAAIDNLLSQAYLGDGNPSAAMDAFLQAAAITPKDEKLYAFVSDACTDHHQYSMGLRVVEAGLLQLPGSARLHYERALFLARLDRFEEARPEFDAAAGLAPDGYIATLARVQKNLYDDKFAEAIAGLRQVLATHRDYQTLSLLGTVLMQQGAVPGQAQFAEAKTALEESAKDQPNYSATQIALGKLAILEERYREAVDHLERARSLEPDNPAVYVNLTQAYRRVGEPGKARQAQEVLAQLLAEKQSDSTLPAR